MSTDFHEFYSIVCGILPDPRQWSFTFQAKSQESTVSWLKEYESEDGSPSPANVEEDSLEIGRGQSLEDEDTETGPDGLAGQLSDDSKEDEAMTKSSLHEQTICPESQKGLLQTFLSESSSSDSECSTKKSRGKKQKLKRSVSSDKENDPRNCANCKTTETRIWRKLQGRIMCNPCVLYEKHSGHPRPEKFWDKPIATRKRKS